MKRYPIIPVNISCNDLASGKILSLSSVKILSSKEKKSSSETIIFFGKMKRKSSKSYDFDVSGKISFHPLQPQIDNSTLMEIEVYKHIIAPLIKKRITPHLKFFIGEATCDKNAFYEKIANHKGIVDKLLRQQRLIRDDEEEDFYDYNKIHILLTEKIMGKTLKEYLINPHLLTKEDWFSILFQLFYTLECFLEIKFMHNDLHANNIFIEKLPKKQTICYKVSIPSRNRGKKEIKYFRLHTFYFLKIYDFDFSVSKNIRNTKVSSDTAMCLKKGACDTFRWYVDLYRITTSFYNFLKKFDGNLTEIKDWIVYFFNPIAYYPYVDLRRPGILCGNSQNKICKKVDITEKIIKPPIYVLHYGFPQFSVSPNKNVNCFGTPLASGEMK